MRPRAHVIPAGDPPDAAYPYASLDQGANGAYGGVAFSWLEETGTLTETDFAFKENQLKPYGMAAYVTASNKALRNIDALSAEINTLLPEALANTEDQVFLTGDGVGKPKGALVSEARLVVSRDTASSIKYVDIVNMMGKMLPSSKGRASQGRGPVWVAHVNAEAQLLQMVDGASNLIYIQGNAVAGRPSTLMGYPVIYTGKVSDVGTEADLNFCDFNYYAIKDGSGLLVASSEHVHFLSSKTVIKFENNVDGQLRHNEPLTLEDGTTQVSSIVVLG